MQVYACLMNGYSHEAYAKAYGLFDLQSGYNLRYREIPRFSDSELLHILSQLISRGGLNHSILDVGCGNGNFLSLVKSRFKDLRLFGQDLSVELIDNNVKDSKLDNITFFQGDLLDSNLKLDNAQGYDFVVVSAVLQTLSTLRDYEDALRRLSEVVSQSGFLILFEGFFDSIAVNSITAHLDYSANHSNFIDSMQYTYLSYNYTRQILESAGLTNVRFQPFHVPIKLEREFGNPKKSFTVTTENGINLSMIEVISQPWCFCIAQRVSSD